MNTKQQIEQLLCEKKKLENRLSCFKIRDSDLTSVNDKTRQIDSVLDDILGLYGLIAQREAWQDIHFEQVILSLFDDMKGVDGRHIDDAV